MGERSREEGQTSAEYLGVLAALAAVAATLLVLAPGVGHSIADGIRAALCEMIGTSCPAGSDELAQAEGDGREPPVCTTSASARDSRFSVDWLFSRSLDGERFLVSRLADGSVVIIDTEYSGSGYVAGLGVDIPLSAQDKLGVQGAGSIVNVEESGRMFVLDEAAYAEYQALIQEIAIDRYMHPNRTLDGILGAETWEEAAEYERADRMMQDVITILIDEHVTHDYLRTTGEVSLDAGVSKGILGGGVTITGSTGKVLAVNRETDDYTITVELDRSTTTRVNASVFGVGAGAQGNLDGGSSMTLTYTADGELTQVSVTTTLEVGVGGTAGLDLTGLADSPQGTGASTAGMNVRLGGAGLLETTYTLPLGDDPAATEQLDAFLTDPAGNIAGFIGLASRNGEVLMQGYEVDDRSDRIEMALRILASAGVSDSSSHRQLSLVDAVSYDPENGLMRRADCLG